MNNRDRADSWAKSRLGLRGKPVLIVESKRNVYLAVVDSNSGNFELVLANKKSQKIGLIKKYETREKPIQVLMSEVKNRELRIVLSTEI